MLWHEHSWPQIQSLNKNLPVIIPLGSIEQHGHHLPLIVDTAQVTAVADRAEKSLGSSALFLPTLWLGCSEHHLDFPGTISVPASLYSQNIKSIARCILHAGFNRIFFLNGHGGNEAPAAQALTEFVGENNTADSAHLAFASWWHVARDSIAPPRHGLTTPAISHACEYETSLMLTIRPDLVNLPAAREPAPPITSPWFHSEYGGKVRLFHRFHQYTPVGSMGRPSAATAQKGESLLTAITDDVVAFIKDFSSWPILSPQRVNPD
ncbi:MAG TPA: creatininase family protein [Tepidisphaeraceae bacterium]|jgi:creatinine amidohydrolase|nr:creatininase family protein [Tepidisphaeraceae bacterium]